MGRLRRLTKSEFRETLNAFLPPTEGDQDENTFMDRPPEATSIEVRQVERECKNQDIAETLKIAPPGRGSRLRVDAR